MEVLNCLTAYITETPLQNELLLNDFCIILNEYLTSSTMILKTTAINFIMESGKLIKFCDKFIIDRTLDWYFYFNIQFNLFNLIIIKLI